MVTHRRDAGGIHGRARARASLGRGQHASLDLKVSYLGEGSHRGSVIQ
jgi:hypothetical protein